MRPSFVLSVIIPATMKMWERGLSIIYFLALEAGAVKMKKDKPRHLTLKQQIEKFRKKMSIPGYGYRAPWLISRSVQDQGHHVSSSPVFGPRGTLTNHMVSTLPRPSLGTVQVDSSSDEDPDPFGVFLHTDSQGPASVGGAASSNGIISSGAISDNRAADDDDEGDLLLELHSQNSVASTLLDSPGSSVAGSSHRAAASSAATSSQACGGGATTSSNAGPRSYMTSVPSGSDSGGAASSYP